MIVNRTGKVGAVAVRTAPDSLLGLPYDVYGPEAPQDIYVKSITVSGTLQVGEDILIEYELVNNSGLPTGYHTISIYRAADQRGTSKVFVTNIITTATIASYTLQIADLGKCLTFEVTPALLSDYPTSGIVRATPYTTNVANIPSVFDVFDKWRFEFESGSLQNQGNSGDAVLGANAPVWDSANSRYNFTRASSQNMTIPKSGTWTETFEIWVKIQMKNTSNTQNIIALASACYLRVNSGNFQINGTNVTAANTSLNTIRVVFNGASSILQINRGSEITFNSGASGGGSGNAFVGSSTGASNYGDFYLHKIYGKENGVLSSTQRDAIWTALGY